MSRPTRPHPVINRKEWMENHLINRRNREDAVRSTWKSAAKYFKAWDVNAKKYAELTSPESYHTSMNAYVKKKRQEDDEKTLNVRRNKLSLLLNAESERYQTELRALLDRRYRRPQTPTQLPAQPESTLPFSPLPPFHVDVQSPGVAMPKEDAEKKDAAADQPKSTEHGTSASSTGEASGGGGRYDSVRKALPAGMQHETSVTRRTESEACNTRPATVERGGSPAPKADTLDSCREVVKQMTRRNVDELVESMKWTEIEASALKQEYAALQHALVELQRMSIQRLQLDKKLLHSEPTSRGNKLRQPYKIQLQAQSHPVQHLLDFDLKFIETMLSVLRLINDKDASLCNDLGQIHVRIMQNLKIEQYELLQSECLFHEEAERMWYRKVDEWEEERTSRAALIEKAWRLIESKVQARLAVNLERQQGNITSRENMLGDLNAGNYDQPKRASPQVPGHCADAMERLQL